MIRSHSVRILVSSAASAVLVLCFASALARAQQVSLPSWARSEPSEPLGLVVDFLGQQDAAPQANPAILATQAGVKTQEMALILASGKAVTAALRAVDRDFAPPPGKADESLFRYHRRRQEVSEAEISKLKTLIPAAVWKSFLAFVIETAAVKEVRRNREDPAT